MELREGSISKRKNLIIVPSYPSLRSSIVSARCVYNLPEGRRLMSASNLLKPELNNCCGKFCLYAQVVLLVDLSTWGHCRNFTRTFFTVHVFSVLTSSSFRFLKDHLEINILNVVTNQLVHQQLVTFFQKLEKKLFLKKMANLRFSCFLRWDYLRETWKIACNSWAKLPTTTDK